MALIQNLPPLLSYPTKLNISIICHSAMASAREEVKEGIISNNISPPPSSMSTVTFPSKNQVMAIESVKIQLDDLDDVVAESNPSSNMWQVYAFAGFMVMRWVWARWKARNNDGDQGEDPTM